METVVLKWLLVLLAALLAEPQRSASHRAVQRAAACFRPRSVPSTQDGRAALLCCSGGAGSRPCFGQARLCAAVAVERCACRAPQQLSAGPELHRGAAGSSRPWGGAAPVCGQPEVPPSHVCDLSQFVQFTLGISGAFLTAHGPSRACAEFGHFW